MKVMKQLPTVLLLIIIMIVGYKAFSITSVENTGVAKTAYDHVMETRTLRCAYATLPPFINVNANTGAIEGPYKTIMETIATRLDLKLEWAEEVGYGEIPAGFQTGRYDAFCGVLWATTIRSGAMLFTAPLYYIPVHVCVPDGVTAFDNNIQALNDPARTFAVYDNDVSSQIVTTLFPKAQKLTVPPTASIAEWMEQLASGKADAIATCDKIFGSNYMAANPGKIRIAESAPITHIRSTFGLPQGDFKLKSMLDQAIFEIVADGTLDKVLQESLGMNYQYLVPRQFDK